MKIKSKIAGMLITLISAFLVFNISVPAEAVGAMYTQVTVAGQTHPLTGTNIARSSNALVLYTSAKGTTTGTNQYGAEATVIGGKVTKIINSIGNQPIPSNGYVLSGHGTSRTWLLTYAKVGAVVSLTSPSPSPTPPPGGTSGFVTRNGSTLMLNGAPYQFVGYNAFGIQGCEGSPWTRTQIDNYFAELPPVSMTRLWATEMYGTATLDQLVASAEAHNQKLILTLNNDFADCVSDGRKNNAWYASGYKNGSYLSWVRNLATRYKNSPAIGMWEPVNEAGAASGDIRGATMKAFYEDFARIVRSIDPNHLIGTGDDNDRYADGNNGFVTASSAVGIDVLSVHDYASDWGPYWEGDPDPSPMSPVYAKVHTVAQQFNKATIVGEMNDNACGISKSTRANNVKNSIQAYLNAGAAGVLVWNRSMSYYNFCPDGEDYIIATGDPLIPIISAWRIPGVKPTP